MLRLISPFTEDSQYIGELYKPPFAIGRNTWGYFAYTKADRPDITILYLNHLGELTTTTGHPENKYSGYSLTRRRAEERVDNFLENLPKGYIL